MLAPYVSAKTVAVGSCLALLGGILVATASADQAPLPGRLVAASELGRAPLPAGDADRSVAGLERSALRLAAALDAVPVREGGPEEDRYCPVASLRVQWTAPAPSYAVGAHLDPVGPAPDDRTAAANGLVVCDGAGYAYMGFEAHWSGAAWVVTAVPSLSDEHGEHEQVHAEEAEAHADEAHADEAQEHGHEESAVAPPAPAPAPPAPAAGLPGLGTSAAGAVDPYARYDPQRTCDPVAKPGTSALSAMLLRTYPASRSLGLSRTCTARGVSEHKEGRAFDWGVNVGVPAQRAAAESALSQLLATDAAGHRHALARRLGVMYLIWDRKIWSAYNPTAGWRPYSGASPHTDHVHISLSWDGAMGRTSYWQGANASLLQLDPALQLAFDGGSGGSGSGGSLPVAPVAHAPAPAGTAPQRRGGRDRKGHDSAAVASAPEQGAPTVGMVVPAPGAHHEEREQRRKARKEGKRREREAREAAAAAAAAEAEAQVQAAAVQAVAAAEQAAKQAAAAPAAGRSKGKTKGNRKAAATAAAVPAPSKGGGDGKAKASAAAKDAGKGAAKGSATGAGKGAGKGSGAVKGTGQGQGKAKAKGKRSAEAPAASGKGGGGKGGGGGGKAKGKNGG